MAPTDKRRGRHLARMVAAITLVLAALAGPLAFAAGSHPRAEALQQTPGRQVPDDYPVPTLTPSVLTTGSPSPSPQPLSGTSYVDSALVAVIADVASRYEGSLGVAVRHLSTGASATLNAERSFRSASLYKLFVLYSTFAEIERGRLSPGEALSLSRPAVAEEPYGEWRAGTRTTVDCALKAMVTVSSNSAAAMLTERVGGSSRVNEDMSALGLRTSGFGRDFASTSAADVALLLEKIGTGRAVNRQASEAMLTLLKAQKRVDRLPLTLPPEVEVAHKTGELPKLRHDAGVVFAPSGTYVFVALADGARNDAAARQVVLELSRAVYTYFEPHGLSHYQGLYPRLAREILRTPDSGGRLAPLEDEWAQTVAVAPAGVATANGAKDVKLREVMIPDLLRLQRAAEGAGASFWVTSGYRAPRPVDSAFVAKEARSLPCPVEFPPSTPQARSTPAPTPGNASAPPPGASQAWLGTMVGFSGSADMSGRESTSPGSAVSEWLADHAWEDGFILPPAESEQGRRLGYEPGRLRWVGVLIAEHLHELGYERNPSEVVTAELERMQRELADPSLRGIVDGPFITNH